MAIILVGSGTVVERLVRTLESRGHAAVIVASDHAEAESLAFAYPDSMIITGLAYHRQNVRIFKALGIACASYSGILAEAIMAVIRPCRRAVAV